MKKLDIQSGKSVPGFTEQPDIRHAILSDASLPKIGDDFKSTDICFHKVINFGAVRHVLFQFSCYNVCLRFFLKLPYAFKV